MPYSWDRHERLSVLAALTLAPARRRLGPSVQLHDHPSRCAAGMTVLRLIHRQGRRS